MKIRTKLTYFVVYQRKRGRFEYFKFKTLRNARNFIAHVYQKYSRLTVYRVSSLWVPLYTPWDGNGKVLAMWHFNGAGAFTRIWRPDIQRDLKREKYDARMSKQRLTLGGQPYIPPVPYSTDDGLPF